MNYVCHNRRGYKLRHNVGTCLRHVSLQTAIVQRITQHAEGMSLRYGVIVLGDLIHSSLFVLERVFAPILAKFLVSLHSKIRMKLDNELLMNLLAVTFGKS